MTEKKKKNTKSEEELQIIENFLKGYVICKRQLKATKYEQLYFGRKQNIEDVWYKETQRAKENMQQVHDFISELDNSQEKLLLYFHYVKNESIARCAELLCVSRSSAFRLRKRALSMALCKAKRSGNIFPELQDAG